jgi:xanthine/uracil/vitamin C permease (AzgA family)
MGEMTDLVVFATGGMLLLASLLHYNRKGAFCTALCVVAVLWWIWSGDWPTEWYRLPAPLPYGAAWEHAFSLPVLWLALNLLFLYMFTLSGVVVSLADIAGGSIQKKGEVLDVQGASACLVTCGLMTLFSGLLGGPPILISPESAGGIKAGARSGVYYMWLFLPSFLACFLPSCLPSFLPSFPSCL